MFEQYHCRAEKLLFMIILSFRTTTYKLTNKNNLCVNGILHDHNDKDIFKMLMTLMKSSGFNYMLASIINQHSNNSRTISEQFDHNITTK